jgi:hypothetical protein
MASQNIPGGWSWPNDSPDVRNRFQRAENHPFPQDPSREESSARDAQGSHRTESTTPPPQPQADTKQRHWKPRTCRICLETVLPTFHPPSESIPGIFQSAPNVTYQSEDGGRLLRPCKCKGTSQYVHEACLQAWRHADPGYAKRNYFQCPTCGFRYRLQRLGWGRMLSSVGMSPPS